MVHTAGLETSGLWRGKQQQVKLKLPVRFTPTSGARTTLLTLANEVTQDEKTMSPSATLARRFQQNWLAKHPGDTYHSGGNLDDSLTSLSWLQNLKVSEITQPRQGSTAGMDNLNGNGSNRRNGIKYENPSSPPSSLLGMQHQQLQGMSSKYDPRLGSGLHLGDMAPSMLGSGSVYSSSSSSSNSSPDVVDYKTNPYVKPPYSYASLICMAMKATRKNKITLSSIYNWITDNFMYYRLTDPSWQNSIRHNLSLNKCFEKVARRKDEPGKGGFWRINPEFGEMAENGVFKKRRGSRDAIIPSPPLKRFKLEDNDDDDDDIDNRRRFPLAAGMKSSTREDKLLSNGSFGDLSMDDDDEDNSLTLRLRGAAGSGANSGGAEDTDFVVGGLDFNWTSILNQDIDIGGKTVKTEAILDDPDLQQSPFLAMSPPSSETNSEDLGLDELFSQTDFSINLPVDFQTNDPLDLTVQGTTIKPPEWWNSDTGFDSATVNANDNFHSDIFNNNISGGRQHDSRLNTPVPPSPEPDHGDAMWGENLALSSSGHHFDLDNLFEFDNIPSPQL